MKKKRLEKSGLLTFSDFSDLLTQSGRRTVNSDSFIINDLNKKGRGTIKEFREQVKTRLKRLLILSSRDNKKRS